MGFDFYVTLNFSFNLDTGYPIIPNGHDGGNYYRIPSKWRYLIDMSYGFLRYYVQHLDGNSCSMETFYEHFPPWEDIKEKIKDFNEDWTEKEHNDFEAFAEWCTDKECFQANWLPS